jgi:hypothetical protein
MTDPYDLHAERAIIADLEHVDVLKRELAEAKEQRDRLAEALEYVVDDLDVETRGRIGHSGKWCSLITAREALAAVKGGGLPNNCQRPELCLLTETCIPCAICPHAVEGGGE